MADTGKDDQEVPSSDGTFGRVTGVLVDNCGGGAIIILSTTAVSNRVQVKFIVVED